MASYDKISSSEEQGKKIFVDSISLERDVLLINLCLRYDYVCY